MMMTTTLMDPI